MKKRFFIIVLAIICILLVASCSNPSNGESSDDESSNGYSAGDSVSHTANSVAFTMNYVPSGGPFTMGEDVVSPTQEVTLTKNFWMGKTEVTQGLWEDVWGTTWPETDPADGSDGAGDMYPAYNVSWYHTVAFCNLLTQADDSIDDSQQVYYSDAALATAYTKANAASTADVYVDWDKTGYRLPTEAEWEYAARYIDGTDWNGGDYVSGDTSAAYDSSTSIGDYAWYSENSSSSSQEVGDKTANALGLQDMSGNVFEWCYDWYAAYSGGTESDPTGPTSGTGRMFRGGCWNVTGVGLRCAHRTSYYPEDWSSEFGFRPCRTAD